MGEFGGNLTTAAFVAGAIFGAQFLRRIMEKRRNSNPGNRGFTEFDRRDLMGQHEIITAKDAEGRPLVYGHSKEILREGRRTNELLEKLIGAVNSHKGG